MLSFPVVNECEIDNGGCAHTCVDTLLSFSCHCNEGYKLGEDGLHCNGKICVS